MSTKGFQGEPGTTGALTASHVDRPSENHPNNNRKHRGNGVIRLCVACGRKGHIASVCRSMNNFQGARFGGYSSSALPNHATIMMAVAKSQRGQSFVLDSCASNHMVRSSEILSEFKHIDTKFIVRGNCEALHATQKGIMLLVFTLIGNGTFVCHDAYIEDVVAVPGLRETFYPVQRCVSMDTV